MLNHITTVRSWKVLQEIRSQESPKRNLCRRVGYQSRNFDIWRVESRNRTKIKCGS